MKKILWFSRNEMTAQQLLDLVRIYGSVDIVQSKRTAKSWKDITNDGEGCDILAVVLPPAILGDLICNVDKPVIRAKSNRVPTGNLVKNLATGEMETEYIFVHVGWERVLKIEIVTEDL